MELEKQVISLELAKKLKELGVKQESLWWWYEATRLVGEKNEVREVKYWTLAHSPLMAKETYSAYTCSELGEMLPKDMYCIRSPAVGEKAWKCNLISEYVRLNADTEANARAKMLIWLIENKKIVL